MKTYLCLFVSCGIHFVPLSYLSFPPGCTNLNKKLNPYSRDVFRVNKDFSHCSLDQRRLGFLCQDLSADCNTRMSELNTPVAVKKKTNLSNPVQLELYNTYAQVPRGLVKNEPLISTYKETGVRSNTISNISFQLSINV